MNKSPTAPIKLSTFWPYQISVLADQVSRYTVSIAKSEAGLNLSQWRVLAAVTEKPGRTSASVVAVTPMDKGIVSRAVGTLIELGLITKTADDSDKRRFSLTATPSGRAKYAKIAAHLNATMVDALAENNARDQFVDTLTAYISHMAHLSPAED